MTGNISKLRQFGKMLKFQKNPKKSPIPQAEVKRLLDAASDHLEKSSRIEVQTDADIKTWIKFEQRTNWRGTVVMDHKIASKNAALKSNLKKEAKKYKGVKCDFPK